jgi:branched-chain amino acid transport system substrate-binding protein
MVKRAYVSFLVLVVFLSVAFVHIGPVFGAERNEIRIGAVNSLTGMDAMMSAEKKWAYEQAVADINKKGGVYVKESGKKLPIKLIFADDKSAVDQAAAAMERLIKINKIDLALSSSTIIKNLAAATVSEKYKIFHLMDTGWIDQVEAQKYKWTADFFLVAPNTSRVPFYIWDTLPEGEKIKRPALMMIDNQSAFGFGETFRHWAKEHGYQFVMDEPYPEMTKDFSSYILKMKAADADALLILAAPTDAITVMRQIRDANLKLRYIHGWAGFWPTEFMQGLGKDANYVIHDGFWTEKSGYPGASELGVRYKKAFGKDSVSVGQTYAAVQILAMAIEKAGSVSSEKVRNAVFGGEFKGTTNGDMKFNDKGLAETSSIALQWWNGERMPVWPPVKNAKNPWKLKLMPVE